MRILLSVLFVCAAVMSGCTSFEERGDEAVHWEDWEGAVQLYTSAISNDPGNFRLQQKLANARERGADYYYAKGMQALAMDDFDAAADLLAQALYFQARPAIHRALATARAGRNKSLSQSLTSEGVALFNTRRLTAARIKFTEALQIQPENTLAQKQLGELAIAEAQVNPLIAAGDQYAKRGDWQAALLRYEEALGMWSDNTLAQTGCQKSLEHIRYEQFFRQGEKQMVSGDWIAALKAFQKAQTNVDSQEVRDKIAHCTPRSDSSKAVQLAQKALAKKNLVEATTELERALSLYSGNHQARAILAEVQKAKTLTEEHLREADNARSVGQWQRAIFHYTSALNLWADNREAKKGLAHCQNYQNYEKQIALGEAAIERQEWLQAIRHLQSAAVVKKTELVEEKLAFARYRHAFAEATHHLDNGNTREAYRLFRVAVEYKKTEEVTDRLTGIEQRAVHLARIALDKHSWMEAKAQYEIVIRSLNYQASREYEFCVLMINAASAHSSGNRVRAIELYQQALTYDIHSQYVQSRLAAATDS